MAEHLETRPSLLLRVRDSCDHESWAEFVRLYAPLVHAFLRNRGLQDADAADVTQSVLQKVSSALPRFNYDREKGTFRSWLYRITRNELVDYSKRRKRQAIGSGDTAQYELLTVEQSENELESQWNHEHRQYLVSSAMKKCQPDFTDTTFEAFERVVLHQQDVRDVAERLGISTGAVYVCKSRVLARLREVMTNIDPTMIGLGAMR